MLQNVYRCLSILWCQVIGSHHAHFETASHFVTRCLYFSVERNTFYDCMNPYSACFSLNNESRKLSYILDLRCTAETIPYCCKHIESIYIYIVQRLCSMIYVEVSVYMYMYMCMYTHMFRVTHNTYCKFDMMYTFSNLCEIQIFTTVFPMCSLLNYGIVNVSDACVLRIVFVSIVWKIGALVLLCQ